MQNILLRDRIFLIKMENHAFVLLKNYFEEQIYEKCKEAEDRTLA